jgi:hypothetical protein
LTGMFPLMGVYKIGWVFVDERGQDLSCEKPAPALQNSILNCFMVRNDPIVTAPGCMRLAVSTVVMLVLQDRDLISSAWR